MRATPDLKKYVVPADENQDEEDFVQGDPAEELEENPDAGEDPEESEVVEESEEGDKDVPVPGDPNYEKPAGIDEMVLPVD